jgi:hypothetical protein
LSSRRFGTTRGSVVDAVDVGVDVAAVGMDRGGDSHRRGVGAAAAGVVIRLVCGLMPWKPATTATSLRSLKRLTISLPSISRIRAEAWASDV